MKTIETALREWDGLGISNTCENPPTFTLLLNEEQVKSLAAHLRKEFVSVEGFLDFCNRHNAYVVSTNKGGTTVGLLMSSYIRALTGGDDAKA